MEPLGLGRSSYWPASPAAARWSCSPHLIEKPVREGYIALFDPLGLGSIVVANRPARQILQRFRRPRTIREALADWPECPANVMPIFQRLRALRFLKYAGQAEDLPPLPSQQLTAWLHVNNDCGLACAYCYVKKSPERMDETTGRAAVEAILRSAREHGYPRIKLKYSGGEAASSYPVVLGIHDHAQALASRAGLALEGVLLSNGIAFSTRMIRALKVRRIRVMISLDGVGAFHDAQRPLRDGSPSFRLIERSIDRLIENGYPPHLSMTLTRLNLAGLVDTVKFALEQNLTFSLNFFRATGTGGQELLPGEQPLIDAMQAAFLVLEEHLPPWSILGALLDRAQLTLPHQRACGVGQDYLVVTQRGAVAKCQMVLEETLGNIYDADPLDLIRNDTKSVRNPPVEAKAECHSCAWRYFCCGGCPLMSQRTSGSYQARSPYCGVYRAILPEAVRLEGLRLLKYCVFPDELHTVC
jgi:uncharacterized protein